MDTTIEDLQTLLTRDDIDVNKHSNKDATPLFIASINGKGRSCPSSSFTFTTKHWLDIGYSALGIMATQNNHTEFVQLLTEAGARQSLLLLRQQHATKQQK